MLGAITGDIIGSRFEFNGIMSTAFDLWGRGCRFTDDSAMTLAVAEWRPASKDVIIRLADNSAYRRYREQFRRCWRR